MALVGFREITCQRRGDCCEVRLGLRSGHSGLETPHSLECCFASIAENGLHLAREQTFRHRCRYPKVRAEKCAHSNELRWRDTDHGEYYIVQAQRLAEDVIGSAKAR